MVSKYHKIQSIYKRYNKGENKGKFRIGEFSCPEFKNLLNARWYLEEKLDGMNTRIILKKYRDIDIEEIPKKWLCINTLNNYGLFVSGRTDRAEIPEGLFDYIVYKFNDVNIVLNTFPFFLENERIDTITLYGEGIGKKIRKGGKYVNDSFEGFDNKFVLFDIKIQNKFISQRLSVEDIANVFKIDSVPTIGYGDLSCVIEMCKNG